MADSKRKSLSKKIRFEVFKRDSFTCQYCGKSAPDVILHIDHIEPVSKGGTNEIFNLVTSCSDCNFGKKDIRLNDKTELSKQKQSLDERNEKLQQLEMLKQYRDEIINSANKEFDIFNHNLSELTGFSLKEDFSKPFKGHIKKYGLKLCLDALDAGVETYLKNYTMKEVDTLISKFSGILYNLDLERTDPEQAKQNKIRRRMRYKYQYLNEWKCRELISRMRNAGISFDTIDYFAEACNSWSNFKYNCELELAEDLE